MFDDKYIECPDCHEITISLNYQTNTGLLQRLKHYLFNREKSVDANPDECVVGCCPECGLELTYDQVDHLLRK